MSGQKQRSKRKNLLRFENNSKRKTRGGGTGKAQAFRKIVDERDGRTKGTPASLGKEDSLSVGGKKSSKRGR